MAKAQIAVDLPPSRAACHCQQGSADVGICRAVSTA